MRRAILRHVFFFPVSSCAIRRKVSQPPGLKILMSQAHVPHTTPPSHISYPTGCVSHSHSFVLDLFPLSAQDPHNEAALVGVQVCRCAIVRTPNRPNIAPWHVFGPLLPGAQELYSLVLVTASLFPSDSSSLADGCALARFVSWVLNDPLPS
jgi:hypothetical protein